MRAHSDPQTSDRSEVMSRAERRLLGLGVLGLSAAVLVVVGYVVPWRWTGVTGNTLWDWIELIVVPFALPVTVTLVLHRTRSSDRS
jgi:hypothetical protein